MEKVPDKTIDQMFHTWSDEDDDRRFGRTTFGPDGHPVGHIIAKDCTAPDHNATMTILIGPYCVCSIESGPCERVESLQMSGRF